MGRKTQRVLYKVSLSRAAITELESTLQYIIDNFDDPFAAGRVEKQIKKKIDSLSLMPKRRKIEGDI